MREQDKVSWESVIHAKGPLRSFFFGINIIPSKGGNAMKQSKLVRKVYQACFDHDAEKQLELRKKEFVKILKHKAEGKPFTNKWTVVQV